MESSTFCMGAIYGFVAAGIMGFILNQIRVARLKAEHQDRQLDQFPDSMHPDLTPIGIVRTSGAARLAISAWSLILILVLAVTLAGAYLVVSA
jgi:hypothetical protein